MSATEQVTVTLPADVAANIDLVEQSRPRFILEAIEHELERRRRAALGVSLAAPHPDSLALANAGLAEWVALAAPDDASLLDPAGGTPIRWVDGVGWVEGEG